MRRVARCWLVATAAAVLVACNGSGDSGGDGDRAGDRDRSRSTTTVPAGATEDRDSTRGDDDGGDPEGRAAAPAPALRPEAISLTPCPTPTATVGSADELQRALDAATPGTSIELLDGTYDAKFVASRAGTAEQPIHVCGPRSAVLDGGGIKGGYALHLEGVAHWHLRGFTVRNAQKGIVADATSHTVLEDLLVEDIGDEGIHLRSFSSDNVVRANEVRDTGQRRAKFGEGIYVGSAQSNWCQHSDCGPDRSDRNLIEGNLVYGTTSEAVDLKEGTTGGTVRGNVFDGRTLSGADSWVDAKGNDWVIEENQGIGSPGDGFQMHEILDGWGTGNTFRDNVADVRGPGHGFATTNTDGNVVRCDNVARAAGSGLSDVACQP